VQAVLEVDEVLELLVDRVVEGSGSSWLVNARTSSRNCCWSSFRESRIVSTLCSLVSLSVPWRRGRGAEARWALLDDRPARLLRVVGPRQLAGESLLELVTGLSSMYSMVLRLCLAVRTATVLCRAMRSASSKAASRSSVSGTIRTTPP